MKMIPAQPLAYTRATQKGTGKTTNETTNDTKTKQRSVKGGVDAPTVLLN